MVLNKNHTVVYCSTRNELINAINAKAIVIEIDGALKKDMDNELKKQLKTQKKMAPIKNLGKGVGIISAVGAAMALINPATWIAFGGASLASALAFTVGGTAVAGITGVMGDSSFKKYSFAIFENHVLLIHNTFRPEYDSIKGYSYKFILSNENKCPNCGKTIKGLEKNKKAGKNPCECPNCKQKCVWTLSQRKYDKNS